MFSKAKSAVHQQAAKLFQQHWRHLKGNYDLNSAFENADRLPEQKRAGSQLHYSVYWTTNIIKPKRKMKRTSSWLMRRNARDMARAPFSVKVLSFMFKILHNRTHNVS